MDRLSKKSPDDYSFVALTGVTSPKKVGYWHTLPIVEINKEKDVIKVLNKRTDKRTDFTFEEFINSFKAIIGIEHR